MLYPFKLALHYLLSTWQAMVWQRIIGFTLAAWFMYGFGRAMGFRPFAAGLAGVVFAFGSFLVAQIHHANVIRSAIWLPFVFFAVEMSLRAQGRRRLQWMALGAIGLGMQSLGVHIQIVLMTLLALGLYLGYRWLLGPVRVHLRSLPEGSTFVQRLMRANANVCSAMGQRTAIMIGAGGLVIALGLGIGAVQLLPLYELAQFSHRGDGVEYAFATTYSLPLLGLGQALFPYLFRAPTGEWWTLWAPWEMAFYVGLPTLVFVLLGAICARNRHTFFFLAILVGALLVALGPNSPINLHRMLWELPGFSAMRAPGRFTFLAVFAAAVLAGWGAHWLDTRLTRGWRDPRPYLRSVVFSVFLVIAATLPWAVALVAVWTRAWLDANQEEFLQTLASGTLVHVAGTGQAAAEHAFRSIRRAVDLTNPTLIVSVALLQATVLGLVLWYGAPRLGYLCKGAVLGFLSLDLLLFAGVYHPTIAPTELGGPSRAAAFLMDTAGGDRTLLKGGVKSLEPNRTLPMGVPTLTGYSSLAPQRHMEYIRPMQVSYDTQPDSLVDAASVRYLVASAKFPGYPFYKNVTYNPHWPLTQGGAQSQGGRATFDGENARGDSVALIATLANGVDLPNDTPLAEVTVVTDRGERRTGIIRAGRHVSEAGHEREDVKGRVKHGLAEKAVSLTDYDDQARPYSANLYYGTIPLGAMVTARSVEYRYSAQAGFLKLYGLALVDSRTGANYQIRKNQKYRLVYSDQEALIYENLSPMPRAYLVGQAILVPPGSHILSRMVEGAFDPRQVALLEDVEGIGMPPLSQVSERPNLLPPPQPFFRPASFLDDEPTWSTIEYDSPDAGFLVLADSYYPGWKAYVDGEPVPMYRANYLFRAIRAPAGRHTVEFKFESATLEKGLQVSLVSLGIALGIILVAELWWLTRVLAAPLAQVRKLRR